MVGEPVRTARCVVSRAWPFRSSRRRMGFVRWSPVMALRCRLMAGESRRWTWKWSATIRRSGRSGGERLVRVRHVERHDADILAARDVRERGLELARGRAVDDLHEPMSSVDDDRHEVPQTRLSAAKEVLVDADLRGPVIEPLAPLELELPIQRRVQPARRAPQVAANVNEVRVPLARAKHRACVPLRVPEALADPWHRFREHLAARPAQETPLLDDEPDPLAADVLVLQTNATPIVARRRLRRAAWAVLLLRHLPRDHLHDVRVRDAAEVTRESSGSSRVRIRLSSGMAGPSVWGWS